MIHVNWQNVLDGHGFAITIIGMAIVFSGLVLISLFIAQLPRLLALFDRLTTSAPRLAAPREVVAEGAAVPRGEEIMAVISLVVHMELERLTGESQKITILRRSGQGAIWASAGKVRSLSQRSPHA
ncbi:OadG family protein [Trichloromonas sp.]|uniref:OadG family protein n=1 Tax=Trichloromonas sp. TaxID=3069249 RepID=UPI002A441FC1|nr:OadG family protein [Trichloromonas sp.]